MSLLPTYVSRHFYDVFPVLKPGYWYGDYDEEKYNQYRFFHDGLGNKLTLGLTGMMIDADINRTRNEKYLERYGLGYSDIVNPGNLYGYTSPLVGGLNFVSDNYRRLYR